MIKRFKNIWLCCGLLFSVLMNSSLASGLSIDEGATDQLLARYRTIAEALLVTIKNIPPEHQVQQSAQDLFLLSAEIMRRATMQVQGCQNYFAALLAVQDELVTLSLSQLEADYHHDGALPSGSAACYHIKDLLVHPAAVLVLLGDDSLSITAKKTAIIAEITEVLEHIDLAAETLVTESLDD